MVKQTGTFINVKIKSKLSGSFFPTRVGLDLMIENVIARAAAKFGTALLNQGLDNVLLALRHVETSTRLKEGRTLGSYHIKDGDTLELYEESKAGFLGRS